jgi:thiamine biosynthesis lipoprotein
MKIALFSFIVLITSLSVVNRDLPTTPIYLDGRTMGTTYHIVYFDEGKRNFGVAIDSLLNLVNRSISTYDQRSEVSEFNRSTRGITYKLPYLYPPLKKAREIYEASDGAFDPTVMPLVKAWGFSASEPRNLTPAQVDSILQTVGFDKLILTESGITKKDTRVQLDFGGIGQGYGADVIADFLRSKGVENFLVELGGEGLAIGRNIEKNRAWEIGILDPQSTREDQFFKAYVSLQNRSYTTSGNYFNYREVNGKRYGHTLDPKTGYPVQHEILSASVFADDCATADAWATAFMAMGLQKSIDKLEKLKGVDALFIYTAPSGKIETYLTPALKSSVRLEL